MLNPRSAVCPRPLPSLARPGITRQLAGLLAASLIVSGCATSGSPPASTPGTAAPAADAVQIASAADTAYRDQDWPTAERLYVALTRARPEDAETWFRLGNIYARTERPEPAVRAYQEALGRDASHARAWHNLGILRMRLAALAFARLAEVAAADDPLRAHGEALGVGLLQLLETDSPATPVR